MTNINRALGVAKYVLRSNGQVPHVNGPTDACELARAVADPPSDDRKPLTEDDVHAALATGRRERVVAERVLKRSPRR